MTAEHATKKVPDIANATTITIHGGQYPSPISSGLPDDW
jgi:hypothetical protein